ncbi:hypothetical protein [Actinomadura rudentiformis]|uniref:Guanylate cyclase domain-containing protein n=1 Tax=Actinomadura rudentiformis TaxID=359158 RepID=A0A6H9Z363_9ACTN|nr:hypothetical protein [Actinomadura rudentiformis]KAB2350163.1 hypothetical protein F8566_10225 [Actinomadura rudentiformis]
MSASTALTLHRGLIAVDIVAFGSRRDPDVQLHLRGAVHQITERACRLAGVCWDGSHHEDRGDGLFVIVEPDTSVTTLLTRVVPELLRGVRRHNKLSSRTAQIRLRVAVHAGFVRLDDHGAAGLALIELFRLLDAPAFRAVLNESASDFAVAVSDYLFDEVVRHSGELAAEFRAIPVELKETDMRGWVWLPPMPAEPHDLPVTDRSRAGYGSPGIAISELSPEDRDLVLAVLSPLVDYLQGRRGRSRGPRPIT